MVRGGPDHLSDKRQAIINGSENRDYRQLGSEGVPPFSIANFVDDACVTKHQVWPYSRRDISKADDTVLVIQS